MGASQSDLDESFQTGRNFILLYVGGCNIERTVYILPRRCPLYENVRKFTFAMSIHATDVKTSVMMASAGDIIVLAGVNNEIDLVRDVQDGGVVLPVKLIQLLDIAQEKHYLAYKINHLNTGRDREIVEEMLYGRNNGAYDIKNGRSPNLPKILFASIDKLKLEE